MNKREDGKAPVLVIGKPFDAMGVPRRSRPYEFLEQLQYLC